MSEIISDKFKQWSLERLRFVLGHIENFIEDENAAQRERARTFSAETGLDQLESLVGGSPDGATRPALVFENLMPFFEAGLLVQRGMSPDVTNWWITHLFSRGNLYHLELADQVRANTIVPEITPMSVHRANAPGVLGAVDLKFLCPHDDADAFVLRPIPQIALVLFSRLATPWAADHLAHAHRLINKSFIF